MTVAFYTRQDGWVDLTSVVWFADAKILASIIFTLFTVLNVASIEMV